MLALSALVASGAAMAEGGRLLSGFGQKLGLFKQQPAFLEPDQAFSFAAEVIDAGTVRVRWRIAEGYYLYRERFAFQLLDGAQLTLGMPGMRAGDEIRDDEFFGPMEVYYGDIEVLLPVERPAGGAAARVRLESSYQGCAEAGYCYPPMSKAVELELPPV